MLTSRSWKQISEKRIKRQESAHEGLNPARPQSSRDKVGWKTKGDQIDVIETTTADIPGLLTSLCVACKVPEGLNNS